MNIFIVWQKQCCFETSSEKQEVHYFYSSFESVETYRILGPKRNLDHRSVKSRNGWEHGNKFVEDVGKAWLGIALFTFRKPWNSFRGDISASTVDSNASNVSMLYLFLFLSALKRFWGEKQFDLIVVREKRFLILIAQLYRSDWVRQNNTCFSHKNGSNASTEMLKYPAQYRRLLSLARVQGS